jgi:DNA (cytosine-5)-methyltransferase 1
MTSAAPVRYLDLFCGIGSFHDVLQKHGAVCVGACDSDSHARATYQSWHGIEPAGRIEDMVAEELPEYDLICAGFPCQPFSLAGHQLGFSDERGTMFSHVMRFANRPSCKYVILENVSSLLTHDKGNSFRTIQSELETAGYTTTHAVLKASNYGLPQMRKRLFIVGVRGAETGVSLAIPPRPTPTMSQLLGKHFDEKDVAYTIRCGGRRSGLGDKHNWDTYLVDGQPYVISVRDCLLLQGFSEDRMATWTGTESQKYMRLGNTIPTCLSGVVVDALLAYCKAASQ